MYLTYQRSVGKRWSNIMCSVKFTISMDLCTTMILDRTKNINNTLKKKFKQVYYFFLKIPLKDMLTYYFLEYQNIFFLILSLCFCHYLCIRLYRQSNCETWNCCSNRIFQSKVWQKEFKKLKHSLHYIPTVKSPEYFLPCAMSSPVRSNM